MPIINLTEEELTKVKILQWTTRGDSRNEP